MVLRSKIRSFGFLFIRSSGFGLPYQLVMNYWVNIPLIHFSALWSFSALQFSSVFDLFGRLVIFSAVKYLFGGLDSAYWTSPF